MRLYEFANLLLEYKRDITSQKLGDKLVVAAQRDRNQGLDTILNTLEQIDPTRNNQYVEWLCRQYISNQFRLEDKSRVNETLNKFTNIKNKLDISKRDINRYTFKSLDDAMDKEYNIELKSDESDDNIPDVKILYRGPLGLLAIPQTQEASCQLGSGTKWCTAAQKDNMFNQYTENGKPLYIWKDKSGKKYQFFFGDINSDPQFMNDKDTRIDSDTLNYFRTKHPVISKLFKQHEDRIISDPSEAVPYANAIGQRWPAAENYIINSPEYASRYAAWVLKGRWPEAESTIAGDPKAATEYAIAAIKGRWPLGEKAISSTPHSAWNYIRHIIRGRWPEAEPAILNNPTYATMYKEFLNS